MESVIPAGVYQGYVANEKIAASILQRIGMLLMVQNPSEILAKIVQEKSVDYPEHHYSSVEDLVIQDIILKYEDHYLDRLWVMYNAGFFEHGRESF